MCHACEPWIGQRIGSQAERLHSCGLASSGTNLQSLHQLQHLGAGLLSQDLPDAGSGAAGAGHRLPRALLARRAQAAAEAVHCAGPGLLYGDCEAGASRPRCTGAACKTSASGV